MTIWKTSDQKPTSGKYVCIYDGFEYYIDTANPDCWDGMFIEKWCDFYDLIAQADKTEQLQKVVDFLSGHLRDVLQLDEYGHIKLDEITKQQIKTAISDPVGIIMQLEQESNNLKGDLDDNRRN